MPPAPVPLSPSRQAAYDELYDLFGKAEADQYALSSAQFEQAVTPPPAPPVATTPAPAPKIAAPVSGQIITGPDGRPQFVPVGMEPAPTPVPEPREQLLTRPGLPELRIDQEKVAARAIEVRAAQAMKSGVPREEAYKEAQQYVEKAREAPRVTEYGTPAQRMQYSELAVRGEELLPRMTATEAAVESLKPQILETKEQAEGRRRFEKAKNEAKSQIETEAKAAGKSADDYVQDVVIGNRIRAKQIADAEAAKRGETATMQEINDIRSMLDAPYYAAVEEMKGVLPNEIVSRFAADTLRGLTQEERFGRLVETPAARTLRVIGGATRIGTEAIRAPVEYATTELAARTSGVPGMTGARLRAEREAEIAEGPRRVATPGVAYEEGFTERQRLETGDFTKDVAYQVATGRSAIDDWYDAGVGKGTATVLGLVTELGLPMTPVGYVTDVAPLVARGLRLGKVSSKIGQVAGDVVRAPRLMKMIEETGKSVTDLGLAMKRPSWWQTMTNATDVRVSTASQIAEELGDAAALERVIRPAIRGQKVDDVAAAVQKSAQDVSRSVLMDKVLDRLLKSGVDFRDGQAIVDSGIIQDEIRNISEKLGRTGTPAPGDVAPDILRNTYAAALKDTNAVGETSERAVRAAIAETLEKVPDSGWSFVTPRLAVKKTVIATKEFQDTVSSAVQSASRANPDITIEETQRVIEEAIKSKFKGTAEPVAVQAPRAPRLLPEAPRGGLERIATAEARRLPGLEVIQDISDTARVIVDNAKGFLPGKLGNPTKRVSDTFAGSKFIGSMEQTLNTALDVRIPVEMRDFIVQTASEINNLGSTVGTATKKGGPIISAMKVQGGFSDYLDARVLADATNPQTLKASTLESPAIQIPLPRMNSASKESVAKSVEKIVRNFFGDKAIAQILDSDFNTIVDNIIKNNVVTNSKATTLDAIASSIVEIREAFPQLAKAGRTSVGQDDIASAALDYIMQSESKVIFQDNFQKFFPELSNVKVTVNDIRAKFIDTMNQMGVSQSDIASAASVFDNYITSDRALTEAVEKAAIEQTKKNRVDSILELPTTSYDTNIMFDVMPAQMLTDLNKVVSPTALPADKIKPQLALLEAGIVDDNVNAAVQFAAQNRLIRSVNESDILTWISDSLKLPITSTERKIIESLVGPLDDLTKGTSAIADNLSAVYRSGKSGLGNSITTAIYSIPNLVRSLSRTGLTVGIVPNIKFHATNYLTAPFILGLTSPGIAMRTTFSELGRFFNLGDLSATNATFVKNAAKNPQVADSIAFTSKTGIPYTYKQLDNLMSQNYFGMTSSTFDFGNQFADDVRIAVGAGPGGKAAKPWETLKDRATQFLNQNGTNINTNFASYVDTSWRQQAFLAALHAGETPETARAIASNAVLDYGRIPGALRTAAARYMTFFSWFAVSNAEVLSAFFRPKAFESIARQIQAQRTLHRGWGEWDYSDDQFKQRVFSYEVGEYDQLPAFFVGPLNPSVSPLIDQTNLVLGLYAGLSGDVGLSDAGKSFVSSIIDKSFTPELSYLKDIGLLGEKRKGLVVPWRTVAMHQALGPEHFAAWMTDMGVTTIPLDKRRIGEPTFFGQQYQYKNEGARDKAATWDFIMMMTGIGRAINDYASLGVIVAPQNGIDLKRFDNTALGVLQYFSGGNLQKGTTEHEQVRKAIEQTNRELREMGKEK